MIGMKTIGRLMSVAFVATFGSVIGAAAHPHIWVDVKSAVVFDDQGYVSEIQHIWTFDEAFSAWAIQGLDVDGDGVVTSAEMQELAETNIAGLSEFEFYTFVGEGPTKLALHASAAPRMVFENDQTTLHFSVSPETPYAIAHELEIEVNDPEYYSAMTFSGENSVSLINAPAGCSVVSHAPKELAPELAQRLSEIGPDVLVLPDDLRQAMRDVTNLAVVTCENGVAKTAVEATQKIAQSKPAAPFSAPPVERGLTMPRGGFLGWVNTQQKAFYGSLTRALSALKTDGNAFWVLGTLSFLYGVFHAAGPGHGKIVISSYVLAGESEIRRGIALSFAAAMLQSVVAIVFVLIAAAVLNMTSIAMSGVAASVEFWSYAMVVGLGLWLLARKLFGFGHKHDHSHHHGHTHDHHTHHLVPPVKSTNWRENIGVVLAVGLRPCSGALVVLVFALSQGLMMAGIGAVFLMGVGTALTVSILASLAVGAKSLAMAYGRRSESPMAKNLVWWIELLGALVLLGFGLVLLSASMFG